MTMHKELRSHPRFAVMWRVLYGNQEGCGQGSVVNVSHGGCQVTTLLPVARYALEAVDLHSLSERPAVCGRRPSVLGGGTPVWA